MTALAVSVLAQPQAISALTGNLLAFLEKHDVDRRTAHRVALIVEEVLTNLGTHGKCAEKPADITITVEPGQIRGEIVDNGLPFDPRTVPDPDFEIPPEERPIGGLGLFLMRQFTCALEYSRRDEKNWTTFAVARA